MLPNVRWEGIQESGPAALKLRAPRRFVEIEHI